MCCVQMKGIASLAMGRESDAGHFVHIAFSTLREKEISVSCGCIHGVSLLFCGIACCAFFYSNIPVKMNLPYGISPAITHCEVYS